MYSVVLHGNRSVAGHMLTYLLSFGAQVYTCILFCMAPVYRCIPLLQGTCLHVFLLFRAHVYTCIVLHGTGLHVYSNVAEHMLTRVFPFQCTCLHVYSVVLHGTGLHVYSIVAGHTFTFQGTCLHVYSVVLHGTGLHVYSVVVGHMLTCVLTFQGICIYHALKNRTQYV